MNGQGNEADQGKHHSSRPLALPKPRWPQSLVSAQSHTNESSLNTEGSFSTVSTVTLSLQWAFHNNGHLGTTYWLLRSYAWLQSQTWAWVPHPTLIAWVAWAGLLTSPTSIYSTENLRIYYYLHVLIRIEWVHRWKILYLAKIKNNKYCCIYICVHKTVNIINGFLWFYSQI